MNILVVKDWLNCVQRAFKTGSCLNFGSWCSFTLLSVQFKSIFFFKLTEISLTKAPHFLPWCYDKLNQPSLLKRQPNKQMHQKQYSPDKRRNIDGWKKNKTKNGSSCPTLFFLMTLWRLNWLQWSWWSLDIHVFIGRIWMVNTSTQLKKVSYFLKPCVEKLTLMQLGHGPQCCKTHYRAVLFHIFTNSWTRVKTGDFFLVWGLANMAKNRAMHRRKPSTKDLLSLIY